jgi:hypothetical protein
VVDLKPFERARAAARQAVRDAEAIVRATGDVSTRSKARSRKHIAKLENALVAVMKHHAVTVADERRLTQLALTGALDVQRAMVDELNAAVTRLRDAVGNAQWNLQVYSAQGKRGGAIAKARAALARMRAEAAKAEALSATVLARTHARLIARLDREMEKVKMCVAVTIADEKRFRALAGETGLYDFWASRLRPPDPDTMARVLAAQRAAVADLKREISDVNDHVEGVKRRARIEAAKRGARE